MIERPTTREICACAAFAGIIGGGFLAFSASFFFSWQGGPLVIIAMALIALPLGLLAGLMVATPCGFIIGLITARTLGWGYTGSAFAGGVTAVTLRWLAGMPIIAVWPDIASALLFILYGMACGMIGWRFVMHPRLYR